MLMWVWESHGNGLRREQNMWCSSSQPWIPNENTWILLSARGIRKLWKTSGNASCFLTTMSSLTLSTPCQPSLASLPSKWVKMAPLHPLLLASLLSHSLLIPDQMLDRKPLMSLPCLMFSTSFALSGFLIETTLLQTSCLPRRVTRDILLGLTFNPPLSHPPSLVHLSVAASPLPHG